MHRLALDLAARVGHAAERIIDQQHVRSTPHESAADTGREIAPAFLGRPSSTRLAVLCQPGVEYLGIFRRGDQVSNVAPKILRERDACGSGDELMVRTA